MKDITMRIGENLIKRAGYSLVDSIKDSYGEVKIYRNSEREIIYRDKRIIEINKINDKFKKDGRRQNKDR